MPVEVRNLGYLTLRNISDPVRAFEVVGAGIARDGVGLLQTKKDLPSIGVIPLKNLSEDSKFDYFADGVVEDIITSLAALKELVVISRGPARDRAHSRCALCFDGHHSAIHRAAAHFCVADRHIQRRNHIF